MEDTDKQALIEKLFIEKLDEEIAEIDPYDFGTFTVDEDNIENTLARYDGKEVWLENGLYAYRVD